MKFSFYKRILFLLLLVIGSAVYGQSDLIMEYTVTNEGKKMAGAHIQVFKNGKVIDDVRTDGKGRADVLLKPNGVYTISVSGIGLVTKKIEVSTMNAGGDGTEPFYYPAEVEIFPKIDGLNYSILDKPIGKVAFDGEFGDFSADANYTKSMQSALKKLTNDYLAKKEAEAANEKEKQKQYDAIIKVADKAMEDEEWEKAESEYKKASALMPLETYPEFQLAELQTKLIKIRATNKRYDEAMAAAKAAEGDNDLASAIAEYQRALGYKPNEEEPKTKIKALQDRIANEAKAEQNYLAAIEKGDNALKANDLNTAKASFEEASKFKPEESYPKNKLAEINDILAKKEAKEKEYNDAIKAGDDALAASDFEGAKREYQKALTIKAGEKYPTDQIAKVDGMMAEAAKREQDYLAATEKGDQALAANDYEGAKAAFTEATKIKPSEDYPKNKIKEINDFLAKAAAKDQEYQDKIKSADNALASKDYTTAKSAYQEASAIKPAEQYPKDKIAEIENALAELAKVEENYNAAIAKGDQALASEDYEAAKSAFNEALSIKANEQYPKDKLAEIETVVVGLQKQEEDYKNAISEGDAALAKSELEEAKTAYLKASELKPTESYPQEKIKEIDGLLAAAEAKEKDYQAAIAEGDAALQSEELDKAEAAYNKAIGLKADEQYPKDQLAEISKKRDALAAEAEAAAKLEADYQAAIKDGDDKLSAEDFEGSKAAYNRAIELKAEEQYPKDQLAVIEEKEKAIAEEKAAAEQLESDYQAAIKEGDNLFAKEDFEAAKVAFGKAGDLKPEESYPKDQLAAIEAKQKEIADAAAAAQQLEADYKSAIDKADAALAAQNFDEAISSYEQASQLKPEENYPKDKIEEAKESKAKLEAEQAEAERLAALQKEYDELITKAEAAYGAGDLEQARKDFQAALALKSEESYPQEKIEEINTTLADAAEQDKAYQEAITEADELLSSADYTAAKDKYAEASSIKPAEQYPKDKIAEIETKLAEIAAQEEEIRLKEQAEADAAAKLEADYQAAVSEGDNAFESGELDKAESAYGKALSIKPEETYPQSQLAEIDNKRAELAAAEAAATEAEAAAKLQADYDAAVSEADQAFESGDLDKAESSYGKALSIKPEETYPQTQLALIDDKRAELAAAEAAASEAEATAKLQADYDAAVSEADQAFEAGDLDKAESSYGKALSIKPKETYPQTQLAAIDDKRAEMASAQAEADKAAKLEADYQAAISEGDLAFEANELEKAEKAYLKALSLKPAEVYPQSQLGLIDGKREEIALKLQEDAAAAEEAARLAKLEQDYLEALEKGDQAILSKDWTTAKAAYNQAIGFKPDESYPKNKLSEIDALIQAEKDALQAVEDDNEKYQEIIGKADQAFSSRAWDQARSIYEEAQKYKPNESYPADQIAEIEKRLAEKAAREAARKLELEREAQNEQAYQTAIAEGDNAFSAEDYNEAQNKYELALGLKSSEEYPKNRIEEIKAILADRAAELAAEEAERKAAADLERQYQDMISEGDANFSQEAFSAAKSNYTKALQIKPNESYPKSQIALINQELEKQRLARQEELKKLDEPIKIKGGPVSSIDNSAEDELDRIYKEMWAKRNSDKNEALVETQTKYTDLQKENREREESRRQEALKKIEDVSVSMQVNGEDYDEYYMQNHETILEKEKALAENRQQLERNSERSRNEKYEDEGKIAKQMMEFNTSRNEEIIEGKKEAVEEDIMEVIEYEKENIEDHQEKIAEAQEDNEQQEDDINAFNKKRAEEHMSQRKDLPATQLKEWETTVREYSDDGDERIREGQNKINDQEVEVRQFAQERKDHFKENQEIIEETIEDLKEEYQRLTEEARKKREENDDRTFYEGEDKLRQDRMAEEYPQGVTEEIVENKNNSTTLRRIKVKGTQVDIYEKTLHAWGAVFYTKNGNNISKLDWDSNSK